MCVFMVMVIVVMVIMSGTKMFFLKKDTLKNVYQVGLMISDAITRLFDHSGREGPETVDKNLQQDRPRGSRTFHGLTA
jgi:hypothetical protein